MENQQEGDGKTTSAPPPDWYENESGVLQWWNGEDWGPIAPEAPAKFRQPGQYTVDGEDQWWDGTEWWSREELADLLKTRSTDLQTSGWIRASDGAVRWWDGVRWISDSEITRILVENFDPSMRSHSDSQFQAQTEPTKRVNVLGMCSVGVFLVSLLFVGLRQPAPASLLLILSLMLGIAGIVDAKRRGLSRVSAVVGCILPIALFVIVLSTNSIFESDGSNKQRFHGGSVSADSSPRHETQPSAEEQRDASMEEQGFHTWRTGEVWLKAADPESYGCDYGTRCIWYYLVSYSGCASGYYVKADIFNANDVAIGWTNEITASVQPQGGVAFELRSADNGGEMMKVSEVSCMG